MRITVIHGQQHKGSTYHVTDQIVQKLSDESTVLHEFFLPADAPSFCVGCYQCIKKDENLCPSSAKVQEIVQAMEDSDVILIDSPAYCMEMTGQLKTLFDHFAYMWLSHRPRESMFQKVGVAISTTAGAGAKKVTKSISGQMFWLGVSTIYRVPIKSSASSWSEVSEKIRQTIDIQTSKTAKKIRARAGKSRPAIKQQVLFSIMRLMQKSNTWNLTDRGYWAQAGWIGKTRPWKEKVL